jgi:hypothetical protein
MKSTYNRIEKNAMMILLVLSIFIFSSAIAYGLGVAPSREIAQYTTEEQTFTFRIINNDHKNMQVRIYAQGELGQYVTADKAVYDIKSSDEEIPITYTIRIPSNLQPGTRSAEIVVLETSTDTAGEADKTLLLSALGIVHELRVNVPYPGKYAEGVIYISEGNVNVNDSMLFTASIINKGTERINSIDTQLIIRGPTNGEIARIKGGSLKGLESKTSGKIDTAWTANVEPGMYSAEYVINYDDKILVIRKTFQIGTIHLRITDLTVGPFTLGAVAEFNVNMISEWNQPIDDVFGELQIIDGQGNVLSTIKTNNFQARPLATSSINAYWNTKDMDVGNYDVRVIMHYAEKTSERIFRTVVGINSIVVQDNNILANVITEEPRGGFNSVLTTLVIILIIINIGWFVYFKFLKKKDEQN